MRPAHRQGPRGASHAAPNQHRNCTTARISDRRALLLAADRIDAQREPDAAPHTAELPARRRAAAEPISLHLSPAAHSGTATALQG